MFLDNTDRKRTKKLSAFSVFSKLLMSGDSTVDPHGSNGQSGTRLGRYGVRSNVRCASDEALCPGSSEERRPPVSVTSRDVHSATRLQRFSHRVEGPARAPPTSSPPRGCDAAAPPMKCKIGQLHRL